MDGKCPPHGHKYTNTSIQQEDREDAHAGSSSEIDQMINIWVRDTFVKRPSDVETAQMWYDAFLWLKDTFGVGWYDAMIKRQESMKRDIGGTTSDPVKLVAGIKNTTPRAPKLDDQWEIVVKAAERQRGDQIPAELRDIVRPFWGQIVGQSNGAIERFKPQFLEGLKKHVIFRDN